MEQGESFVITNNGHEVATIGPVSEDPFLGLTVTRSDPQFSFATISPQVRPDMESNAQILESLRGEG